MKRKIFNALRKYLFLKGLFTRCSHEWLLQRRLGGNETMGNITLKHGSRLIKWCDKCGKTTSPTKQELEENPPIFRTIQIANN